MTSYPVGVAAVVFGRIGIQDAATRASALGFEHLDVSDMALANLDDDERARLALPIGELLSGPDVRPNTTAMALYERRGEDRFDEAVELFTRNPGARLEPGPRSVADSVASCVGLAPNQVRRRQAASPRPEPTRPGDLSQAQGLAQLLPRHPGLPGPAG